MADDLVTLHGGPLDGQTLDTTGWTPQQRADGVALISPLSAYGPGGRSLYAPSGNPGRWDWEGDTP